MRMLQLSYAVVLVGLLLSTLTSARRNNDDHPHLRKLQEQSASPPAESEQPEQCSSMVAQNTTYNNKNMVPPYRGIMFEVFSKGDALEILTLEIDVHFDENVVDPDLSIEVYSLAGKFELVMDDASAWTLHTAPNTRAVRAPEGTGVIIPRQAFTPIIVVPRERRAFYIRMKNPNGGAFIDSNVDALIKTGEICMQSPDFSFYAGVGLNDTSSTPFSTSDFDKTVDPQFAGVIHYHKETKCRNTPQVTTANYEFLIMLPVTRALMTQINTIINNAVDTHMRTSPLLTEWTTTYGLQRNEMAATKSIAFTGNCPSDWEMCGDTAVSTSVSFVHLDTLDSGRLLEQLYQFTEDVFQQALVDGLAELEQDVNRVVSIGLKSTWADFVVTIQGVPLEQQEMNANQQSLFQESMLQFLNTSLPTHTDHLDVYSVNVLDQLPGTSRRSLQGDGTSTRTLQNTGSIQVMGSIAGAQNAFLTEDNFAFQIESALKKDAELFLSILHGAILRPHQVDDTGLYEYFVDVSSVQGDFVPGEPIHGNLYAEEDKEIPMKPIAIITLGVIGGILFVAALYYFRRYRIENALYKKELAEYRDEMKIERRKRRGELPLATTGDCDSGTTVQSDDARGSPFDPQPRLNAKPKRMSIGTAKIVMYEKGYDEYAQAEKDEGFTPFSRKELLKENKTLQHIPSSPNSPSSGRAALRIPPHKPEATPNQARKGKDPVSNKHYPPTSPKRTQNKYACAKSLPDYESGVRRAKEKQKNSKTATGKEGDKPSLLSKFMAKQAVKQAELLGGGQPPKAEWISSSKSCHAGYVPSTTAKLNARPNVRFDHKPSGGGPQELAFRGIRPNTTAPPTSRQPPRRTQSDSGESSSRPPRGDKKQYEKSHSPKSSRERAPPRRTHSSEYPRPALITHPHKDGSPKSPPRRIRSGADPRSTATTPSNAPKSPRGSSNPDSPTRSYGKSRPDPSRMEHKSKPPRSRRGESDDVQQNHRGYNQKSRDPRDGTRRSDPDGHRASAIIHRESR